MPASPRIDIPAEEACLATNRYYDPIHEVSAIKLLPGEYFVASGKLLLVTVLGSCVAACIRDRFTGVGGMNHFMLPDGGGSGVVSGSARYGTYAMELLINRLLKSGARRNQLEAKVFGGGRVMQELTGSRVGDRNVEFVFDFLKAEGIPVASKDVLGTYARKVYFFPDSGRVRLKKLFDLKNDTVARRERDYQRQLAATPATGEIELF